MGKARKLSIKLPILSGGISDQPAHLRHASQVASSVNFMFDAAIGATVRPGTQLVSRVLDMPDAASPLGSTPNSADPVGALGTAPIACVSADHASSYAVIYNLTGTDPDGKAISHTGVTTTVNQLTNKCQWSGTGSVISTLTPYVFLGLDTRQRYWVVSVLFVPATADPVTPNLYGMSISATGANPNSGASFSDPEAFGAAGGHILTMSNVRAS
tara:strand:+ start:5742 stop:6383 length:642 start_codon:yes stop_codon:yes gene_type:complete